MKSDEPISIEQLNAYLDNQLEQQDRAQVLAALRADKSLSDEMTDLQQLNELVALAYQEVPASPHRPQIQHANMNSPLRIAAAFAILITGSLIGWFIHKPVNTPALPFQNLAQLDVQHLTDDKILIHINAMDNQRILNVLDETELLLKNARQTGKHLQLEVVANASGLGMLRQGSPYTQRIHQIVAANTNVSFLACGFAMEHAKLKEGHAVELIPDAQPVDAALEQILRRLKSGWLYVRA